METVGQLSRFELYAVILGILRNHETCQLLCIHVLKGIFRDFYFLVLVMTFLVMSSRIYDLSVSRQSKIRPSYNLEYHFRPGICAIYLRLLGVDHCGDAIGIDSLELVIDVPSGRQRPTYEALASQCQRNDLRAALPANIKGPVFEHISSGKVEALRDIAYWNAKLAQHCMHEILICGAPAGHSRLQADGLACESGVSHEDSLAQRRVL